MIYDDVLKHIYADNDNIAIREDWLNKPSLFIKLASDLKTQIPGFFLEEITPAIILKRIDANKGYTFDIWAPSLDDFIAKDWILTTITEHMNKTLHSV